MRSVAHFLVYMAIAAGCLLAARVLDDAAPRTQSTTQQGEP